MSEDAGPEREKPRRFHCDSVTSMEAFETRFERLELKYVVDEPTAARIRRDIAPYCREDENASARSEYVLWLGPPGYVVHSLYLDTPSLAFHRAKERGESERFKLRIRTYSSLKSPVFELKRRSGDVVEKTRAVVDRGQIRDTALGRERPVGNNEQAKEFLDRFARLVVTTGAEPSLLVRYRREAHTSLVDEYARVTIDRHVAAQRTKAWDLHGSSDGWCELDHHLSPGAPQPLAVLELKSHYSVPHWMIELVRRHDLIRQSFSKYSIGIYMTGRLDGSPNLAIRTGRILR